MVSKLCMLYSYYSNTYFLDKLRNTNSLSHRKTTTTVVDSFCASMGYLPHNGFRRYLSRNLVGEVTDSKTQAIGSK